MNDYIHDKTWDSGLNRLSSIVVHMCFKKIHVQPVRQREQISTYGRMEPSNSSVTNCLTCRNQVMKTIRKIWLVCLRSDLFQLPHTLSNHTTYSHSSSRQTSLRHQHALTNSSEHNEAFAKASKLKISNWQAPSFIQHSGKRRVSMKRLQLCRVTNAH